MPCTVVQVPILKDNYVYVLHEPQTGQTAVVDPGRAAPVIDALHEHGWTLDWILNTHHHWDHTDGNLELKHHFNCRIAGPAAEAARIPGLTDPLHPGDVFRFGATEAHILDLGGHTLGQIGYWFTQDMNLFSGDAIFAMGCGRLFEGDAKMGWQTMQRIRALPPATRVHCTHEYSRTNARFALTIDNSNNALIKRALLVEKMRDKNLATVPYPLSDDLVTNPFLRCDSPDIMEIIGFPHASPEQVFGELRRMKDVFV